MSDRSFVLAMWHNGLREWDHEFTSEWLLTSVELLGRGIITEAQHLAVARDVRQSMRRYEQLRLDGVSPVAALENMVNAYLDSLGRPGPAIQAGETTPRP